MGGNVLFFLLNLWSNELMLVFVTGAVLPVIGPETFFTRGYCIIFIFFFQYSGAVRVRSSSFRKVLCGSTVTSCHNLLPPCLLYAYKM